jgi:hypothetical protein
MKRSFYRVTGNVTDGNHNYHRTVGCIAATVESAARAVLARFPGSELESVTLVGEVDAWADGNEATP